MHSVSNPKYAMMTYDELLEGYEGEMLVDRIK
jgi:hypothetical protein